MAKKVMLCGYLHDANFGDMLSARLFYERCLKNGLETDFFQYKGLGIGEFCRKETGYERKISLFSCFTSDAFVIISGGCLWNDKNVSNDAKIRFKRFVFPALVYQFLGKPVYVLGVGGGPVDTGWLRKLMVWMLNRAKLVVFRDRQTKEIFEEYGVNNVVVTADTMLVIDKKSLESFACKGVLDDFAQNRKKILLHIPDGIKENAYVVDVVLPGLIRFLKNHLDYCLVLSNDNIRNMKLKEVDEVKKIRSVLIGEGIVFYDYVYQGSSQMCSLINEMDCIITLKLHVGAIGCSLGKSVVAFPVHREKTDNFYEMIGESERCVNVRKLTVEKVYEQIDRFYNRPVCISDDMRVKALSNIAVLDSVL